MKALKNAKFSLRICDRRIMAITSAFQADDVGSIPIDRSKFFVHFMSMWSVNSAESQEAVIKYVPGQSCV